MKNFKKLSALLIALFMILSLVLPVFAADYPAAEADESIEWWYDESTGELSHGDAGYQFQLVPGYHIQILIWQGDEEFPPNAQVLYSENFAQGFAAEDRVVAGDILISTIKANM